MLNIDRISSGLEKDDEGIWYASAATAISYPEDGNTRCAQIEDASFWFKHRNRCIVELVKAYPHREKVIVDVGGGNGYVAKGLSDAGFSAVLLEPGPFGARLGKERGIKDVICASLEDARFKAGTLPAVGLFDVIEHIEDDVSFLRTIHSLLAEDGRIYLTVPAYQFLWSNEDRDACHYRRYTVRSMTEVLAASGFAVEYSTYIFRFLPLPIFFLRTLPTKLGLAGRPHQQTDRDHASDTGMLGRVFDFLLSSETRHIRQLKSMAFGGSCLITARKINGPE
jgi:SAM-dependent methyltransferase